ncbi:MAG TPA: hypothetical protein VGN22_02145 [Pseudonocardia sp.]
MAEPDDPPAKPAKADRLPFQIDRLAEAVARQVAEPVWQQINDGESRWPVTVVVSAAVAMQLALPSNVSLPNRWIIPSLEGAIAIGLIAANPRRINRISTSLRVAAIGLIGLMSLANCWAAVRLVRHLIHGTAGDAPTLLSTGAAIWLTNVIAFAMWYWELDRGGPAARANAVRDWPDFLFVQMQNPDSAPRDWQPAFVDYFYLAFTNATAFSPTDVMPLSRWAKLTMMVQAAVALVVVVLVVARAINALS